VASKPTGFGPNVARQQRPYRRKKRGIALAAVPSPSTMATPPVTEGSVTSASRKPAGLDGTITTVAGTGVSGVSGDGQLATSARLKNPKSVALYGGSLYIADLSNKVRKVNLSTGIITRVAGTGVKSYTGDGGPALNATLNQPQRLAIDSVGNIYVADSGNSAVRRVDAVSGTITTVAGTGVMGL